MEEPSFWEKLWSSPTVGGAYPGGTHYGANGGPTGGPPTQAQPQPGFSWGNFTKDIWDKLWNSPTVGGTYPGGTHAGATGHDSINAIQAREIPTKRSGLEEYNKNPGMMDNPYKGTAYEAPSWGGGQQGPLQMPGGVRDRSTMFDPSLGGKGGFSMTKGAGMASNIGDIARRFKPMSKGGYSIGEMFKPGGMTNKLLGKGGKVGAAISGAPAWAMPAAGAAAFGVKHIMKRSKQKKHQKQQNAQRDQIKNAAANGQYVTGNLGNLSGPRNY